jgi:hypothetical protein
MEMYAYASFREIKIVSLDVDVMISFWRSKDIQIVGKFM